MQEYSFVEVNLDDVGDTAENLYRKVWSYQASVYYDRQSVSLKNFKFESFSISTEWQFEIVFQP